MRPAKNGFEFVETTEDAKPYKLWHGDLWECQDCGIQVIHTDSRQQPIAEHYQAIFTDLTQGMELATARPWSRK
jgi:Zn-finger protein